jgi:hypothetical protein
MLHNQNIIDEQLILLTFHLIYYQFHQFAIAIIGHWHFINLPFH